MKNKEIEVMHARKYDGSDNEEMDSNVNLGNHVGIITMTNGDGETKYILVENVDRYVKNCDAVDACFEQHKCSIHFKYHEKGDECHKLAA